MPQKRSVGAQAVPVGGAPAVVPDPPKQRKIKPPERPTDPMELIEGEIPIFNPNPFGIDIQASGMFSHVRRQGVDFVPEYAADFAVGVDNSGGAWSHLGVRRLYGPEPRFLEDAERSGKSLVEWVRHRNEVIMETARQVMAGAKIDTEKVSGIELSRG